MQDDQDHFNILRTLNKVENPTQRLLAGKLGFSLGKLNYCLKALKLKGLVKIQNFRNQSRNVTDSKIPGLQKHFSLYFLDLII